MSAVAAAHFVAIIDRFSGPDRPVGPVCVSLCIWIRTVELSDLWPRYLAS